MDIAAWPSWLDRLGAVILKPQGFFIVMAGCTCGDIRRIRL